MSGSSATQSKSSGNRRAQYENELGLRHDTSGLTTSRSWLTTSGSWLTNSGSWGKDNPNDTIVTGGADKNPYDIALTNMNNVIRNKNAVSGFSGDQSARNQGYQSILMGITPEQMAKKKALARMGL